MAGEILTIRPREGIMRDSARHPSHTRRDALKTGLAVILASHVAPAFVRGEEEAAAAEAILGEGDHRYRCIHDWGMANLPAKHGYGNASHGVTIDRDGLVYVSHQGGPDSIFVFDPDGKFVRSLAPIDKGSGHGIDLRHENGEDFLYLSPADPKKTFHKMNLKGELVWEKGKQDFIVESDKYTEKSPYRPTNTSFTPDGGFHLGDGYGNHCIVQYDKDGKYLRTIGGKGKADGQFETPHGQWLDDRDGVPKLAVCDRANARLQWFDMEGNHLRTQDGFLFPADIDIRGDIMVVPDLHCRVTLLDKDNNVITHLGGQGDFEAWKTKALAGFKMRSQRDQWLPGRFIHPHDACFDSDGNIFVAEWVVSGRVTKLERII